MTSVFAVRTNTPFTKNTRLRANQPIVANSETLIASEDNLELNKKFKRALFRLNEILDAYSTGNFEELDVLLTPQLYSDLSLRFIRLKNKYNKDYERIRKTAIRALQGAYRASLQHVSLEQMTAHNEYLAERASILDDRTKLADFINILNNTRGASAFGDHEIQTTVSATIDPEYLLYIQTFGFPEDGVFDADRLGRMRRNV